MSSADVAHLYRRAGFGLRPDELAAAAARGYTASVDALLDLSAPDPAADAIALPTMTPIQAAPVVHGSDPAAIAARKQLLASLSAQGKDLALWWLGRMIAAGNPLREKLTLTMHNQFPTSIQKVRFPALMYGQNQIFRSAGAGGFDALTQAVAKDPAMLIWLDAGTDKKAHPNENFARELMERFTMGLGNYSEEDVRQGARAFTGWTLDRATGAFALRPAQHDDGVKTFLGHTANLSGEEVIDIVTHTPASARWVVSRLWSFLAYPVATTDPVVTELSPGYQTNLDVSALLRAIFTHPQFVSTQAKTGLVKQPIEWVAGSLRALRLPATSPALLGVLNDLGQVPFAPPSVGGWPQNGYWLSTAADLARLRFAAQVVKKADLSAVADVAPSQRPEAAANLLSVAGWSAATASALAKVATSPIEVVALALVSPEYLSN